jgi:alpha-mannosidase
MSGDSKKTLLMVSHTHWDREWYLTFNQFRLRLVNVVDKALELAQNPAWNSFMLDGQTAPVEDYLEMKPEMAGTFRKAVESGKLVIGPWFVLADEFLESAEGLVRNLLIGHAIADKFGKPMKCGYVPDTFGHIWQLPQILAGFGIKTCYLYRGYPPLFGGFEEYKGMNEDTPLEFYWDAPDGTSALTLHHITGYGNASNLSEAKPVSDMEYMPAVLRILSATMRLAPRTRAEAMLIMNGSDHLFPDENVPEIVEFFNNDDELSAEYRLEHGKLEDYFGIVAETAGNIPHLAGEMRGSMYTQVTGSCISSRMYIKQLNWQASTELEHWAEGLSVLAWYLGARYPQDQLRLAWKMLLRNHPHDSICTCSIDRVHADMETRFAEVMDIAGTISSSAMGFILGQLAVTGAVGATPFVVVNATNWVQSGPVKALVSLPSVLNGKPLRLVTADGTPVPARIADIPDYRVLEGGDMLYQVFHESFHLHHVEMLASDVPSFGYKTYFIEESDAEVDDAASSPSTTLENEFLLVKVNDDGTIDITDKVSGKDWPGLLLFEDCGDDGDEYDYAPMHEPVDVLSRGKVATISPVESNPTKKSCKVSVTLDVPDCITPQRARSTVLVPLQIDVLLELYQGERVVRASIEVNNAVNDHRLRALFPSGLDVQHSFAADHFMVMKRDIALPRDDGWYQPAQGLYHTDGWVDLSDDTSGLGVLVQGLPEFEILPAESNAIAITLFRAVGFLSRDGWPIAHGHLGRPTGLNGPFLPVPGAQCHRRMRFNLAIVPHAGDWQAAKLFKLATAFQVPFRGAIPSHAKQFIAPALATPTPKSLEFPEESMISFEPEDLVVTAVKRAEHTNAIVIRLFNPTAEHITGQVHLSFTPRSVDIVNLNEELVEAVMHADSSFEVDVKPSQIMTYMVIPTRKVPE